jgi:hypothetical protein
VRRPKAGEAECPRAGSPGRSARSCGRSAECGASRGEGAERLQARSAGGVPTAAGGVPRSAERGVRGRSAHKRGLRAECLQLRGGVPSAVPREARGAECLQTGSAGGVPPAGGVPRTAECGASRGGGAKCLQAASAGGSGKGAECHKRGLRAECLQLRAECLSRAECASRAECRGGAWRGGGRSAPTGVWGGGAWRGEGAECLQSGVCGRSACSCGWRGVPSAAL